MDYNPIPTVPFDPFGGLRGTSPGSSTGGLSSLGGMVAALMKRAMGQSQGPGYEGNIASPANPYDSGTYGMPSTQSTTPPTQPNPNVQQAGQWSGKTQPNPWTSGASPFQFGNNPMASMLSTPPPFGGS